MGDILSSLEQSSFVEFIRLFRPSEGRMGVTVTFMAILELVREGLIDIVQAEPFAPLHVRASGQGRTLRVVSDNGVVSDSEALMPEVLAGPVTPVENIITELPLDPDFIDDSDEDELDLPGDDVVPPSPDEAS
jgi:segregation and condensation protein A